MMATYIDLGDKSTNGQPFLPLGIDVKNSDSIVVKVVAGDTVTYNNPTGGESGTIASGASHTFTTPAILYSAGRSSLKISDSSNAISKRHGL